MYPTEIVATLIRRIIEISFLTFLWTLVLRNSHSTQTVPQLISYFFIAAGVEELVAAQWGGSVKLLARAIRKGGLSNYLIKPVSIIPTFFFMEQGTRWPDKVLAIVYILVGILINPPHGWIALALFITFFIASFGISLCYSLLQCCLYFYVPDTSGINNSLEHVKRILSGAAIPLTFFPANMLHIVQLLPFQAMIYAPTHALSTNALSLDVFKQIGISYLWFCIFIFVTYAIWKHSIKNYEASGI